jgi:predicted TIM-barrel fold metal-dependent hydrolase
VTASPGEEILDPTREIVDAHHHFWLAHKTAAIDQNTAAVHSPTYSVKDFQHDTMTGHRVTGSVYVECEARYRIDGPKQLRPVGETDAVAALDKQGGLCAGMVAFADLALGADVGEVLDAHLNVPNSPVRGVRYIVAWDPHPDVYATSRRPPAGVLTDPKFLAGVAEVAKRGLSFETWLYFHQLHELARFADDHPDLTIILDHLGGPGATGPYARARGDVLRTWRDEMLNLSSRANVTVKLGAIGMRAFTGEELFSLPAVTSQNIADYWGSDIGYLIDTFGPARCMFESNFPVDRALCDYATLWNAYKRIAAEYSESDKDLLFAGTARATYRLPVPVDETLLGE